jgi:quinol monooxygenase YgiN
MYDFFKLLENEGLVAASREDKGNLKYALYVNAEDPKNMLLIEQWESEDDMKAHAASDIAAKFVALCDEYGVTPSADIYEG